MLPIYQIRPLSSKEEEYLRRPNSGVNVQGFGRLSKMGPSNHHDIIHEEVEIKLRKIHLGHGQYFWDGPNSPLAKVGVNFEFKYSAEYAYTEVFNVAREIGIAIIDRSIYPLHKDIVYFESMHWERIMTSLKLADSLYSVWNESRSLLSHIFGALYMDYSSKEAIHLRSKIREILLK